MTRHLVKLVWRRKRATGLIMAEIFVSFLVVFVVATLGLFFLRNYGRPLGFDYRGAWAVSIQPNVDLDDKAAAQVYNADLERVLREIRRMDGVESAAMLSLLPYDDSTWDWTQDLEDGRAVSFHVNQAGDGLEEVLGIRLQSGRWFGEDDAALGWQPVVINASMALELFGPEDPIGRRIPFADWKQAEVRVVGVIADFRKAGELSAARHYLFQRAVLETLNAASPRNLVLRPGAGTPAAFEEAIVRRLQALAPGWTVETRSLEEMRDAYLRKNVGSLLAGGTIAGFLLLMVGLGLTGVLWQNVTQRRREIGLRRASGATAGAIHRQIVTELVLMAGLAVGAGLVVVLQVPALAVAGFLGKGLVGMGAAAASAVILFLAVACGWYPSWLATRVHPVEALHYE